ncbi:MAG: hypothetical protein KJO44_08200 [Gemmatimonadetes bacterium]|nr:hypothetical protein [Gemmatimonadota bacterium]
MGATPDVRRRLLGLAVAVLAPALLPESAAAQSAAGGTVRLVVRADAIPPVTLELDSEAILWMAPQSIERTERLAALWANGDDVRALEAWRAVVEEEVAAARMSTDEQAEAAAAWIAVRAMKIAARHANHVSVDLLERRAEEIRGVARIAAMASIEARD